MKTIAPIDNSSAFSHYKIDDQQILVLTSEHAVNTVPKAYSPLFIGHKPLLQTHRGIDFGALAIARHLSKAFNAELIEATVTRLLIDCNRSLTHGYCFSEITKGLTPDEKQHLIDGYYLPFRQQAERAIETHIQAGKRVLHLSIHSFTPELHGQKRNADISFLYDPKRSGEKAFARQWKSALNQQMPDYRIRMNYPYLGISDGFTSALRKRWTDESYLGLEVEANQALTRDETLLNQLVHDLAFTVKFVIYGNIGG